MDPRLVSIVADTAANPPLRGPKRASAPCQTPNDSKAESLKRIVVTLRTYRHGY